MTENTEVVVVGGGYAGVLAANRLTQRGDVTVTLINARPRFVERIRLHQLVGGTHHAVVEYNTVLAERVRLVVDTAIRVDPAAQTLVLASGNAIGYDYLIYAVGSGSADPSVSGAGRFAYPMADLEQAHLLRSALDDTPRSATITVVGGGPLGIEAASELAELGRQVTLVCGGLLGPYLHPRARRSVAKRMDELGVAVHDGPDASVTAVTRDTVRLGDGRELPSTLTIWAAGFGVPDLAARSGLSTDTLGRLVTDETLTSVDDERILAAGDSAAPSNLPYRMSCQAAVQLGPKVADTVLSRIAGEQPTPLAAALAAQCLSLGRRAGIYQFARRDDTAISLYIGGRAGAKVKEIVCSGITSMLTREARKPGSLGFTAWAVDHKRRALVERIEA